MTVLASFEKFRKNLELTNEEKIRVQDLHRKLRITLEKIDNPPIVKTLIHGSWKRKTTIRPINDADILAILDPNYQHSYVFDIFKEKINPKTILNTIRNKIIDFYPEAEVKRNRPCIVIQMMDSRFEILPVYEDFSGYFMPNSNLDDWEKTDPDKLANRITSANYANDGKFVPFIKMMKHWRNRYIPRYNSFKLEEFTCDIFDKKSLSYLNVWYRTITKDYRYLIDDEMITSYPIAINYWFERFKKNFEYFSSERKRVENCKEISKEALKLWEKGNDIESNKLYQNLFGIEFPL